MARHGKGDYVENGRMISRIGARRTCTHLRWKVGLTDRAEWQRVAIDMQSTPTGDLAHGVKEERRRPL